MCAFIIIEKKDDQHAEVGFSIGNRGNVAIKATNLPFRIDFYVCECYLFLFAFIITEEEEDDNLYQHAEVGYSIGVWRQCSDQSPRATLARRSSYAPPTHLCVKGEEKSEKQTAT